MKLGLYAESDSNWIAGVLYLQTFAKSLAQLPESERPELNLLWPPSLGGSHYEDFVDAIHAKLHYSHRSNHPLTRKLRSIKNALKLRPIIPRSLEGQIERNQIDLLVPCQQSLGAGFPIPWIGWIPDFQHKRLPDFFSELERSNRDRRFQQLIYESSHLIVSSEDAKKDLLLHYDVDPQKTSTYKFSTFAENSWFDEDPTEIATRLGLPEKFLIFPSQFWKHKNHLKLFQSIRQLKKAGLSDIKLVLTGNKHDFRFPEYTHELTNYLEANDLKDTIFHLGLLPRIEQIQLVRQAAAVIQPSYFEGWSMLVEDARALGKHILLSDIPVHREQAYERTTYFDPQSTDEISQVIQNTWPTLAAGPDFNAEAKARTQNQKRTHANGKILMEIFKRTHRD